MATFMTVIQPVKYKKKVYEVRKTSSTAEYRKLYRFKKENVDWLASYFLNETYETRGGALSSEEKMRVFLRYLGDAGFQSNVAEHMGIKQSTVSYSFWHVVEAIKKKANNWIKFPTTNECLQNAKSKWCEYNTFPNAIGAVGCMQVTIKKPHKFGDEYINRKGIPSVNVQATCNASGQFTSVDISWPGSLSCSRVWQRSEARKVMSKNEVNVLLLGDERYGLSPWLMTPYDNAVTPEEKAYNKCIKEEQSVIERCFSELKQRFPLLGSKIRIATERIPSVILCCFVLHNIAKYLNDVGFGFAEIENNDEESSNREEEEELVRNKGHDRREEIAKLIYSPAAVLIKEEDQADMEVEHHLPSVLASDVRTDKLGMSPVGGEYESDTLDSEEMTLKLESDPLAESLDLKLEDEISWLHTL